MKKIISLSLLAMFLLLQTPHSKAQQSIKPEWNQFRGFQKNGIVQENILPEKWPDKGLKMLWKKETWPCFF